MVKWEGETVTYIELERRYPAYNNRVFKRATDEGIDNLKDFLVWHEKNRREALARGNKARKRVAKKSTFVL